MRLPTSSPDKTSGPRGLRWFFAAVVFIVLLLRPAYMVHLRGQAQAKAPEERSKWSMNGSFSLLLPQLFATRYHDEALYSARVRQILLHGIPSDPYWQEDEGRLSWLHDCVSLYILAAAAFVCGSDLTLGWILTAAILAALWFLLFHAAFKWWSGKEEVAVPLALFSILFPDLYSWLLDVNFSAAVNLERYTAVFFQHFSEIRPHFYRLPSNFLSMFLMCLLFLATWRLADRKEERLWIAPLLGCGYGLMTMVHAYAFAFGLATLGIYSAAIWLQNPHGPARRNFAVCLLSAFMVVAVYTTVMTFSVSALTRADSLEIVGIVRSRKFYLITLVHLAAAAFGWWKMKREADSGKRAAWMLLASSQIAAFLCRNSQVVTGLTLQPFHFIPLGSFTGCLMLFLWLAENLARRSWWDRRMGAIAAVFVLVWALANEKSAAERTYKLFGLPRDIENGLQWVQQTLPGEPLILSLSMEVNEIVPLHTRAKVQVPPASPNNSTPFSKEKYFYKVAQLLKTCRVDPERFLAERWLTPGPKNEILGRLSYELNHLQQVDRNAFEPAEWFYQFWWNNQADEPILRARERIKTLSREVPPVEGSFYLWINDKDVHLLSAPPVSFGGKLLYQNPSVQIYAFKPAAQLPPTKRHAS